MNCVFVSNDVVYIVRTAAQEQQHTHTLGSTSQQHGVPFPHENVPQPSISSDRSSRLELSAEGRNVLITGMGSGIGRSTAIAFARARAKANIVVLTGRRVEKLEDTKKEIEAAARS